MSQTCPGCMRPILAKAYECVRCRTHYHAECRDPLGCVVAGCTQAEERRPRRPAPPADGLSWPWWCARAAGGSTLISIGLTFLFERTLGYRIAGFLVVAAGWGFVATVASAFCACIHDLTAGAKQHRGGTGSLLCLTAGVLSLVVAQVCGAPGAVQSTMMLLAAAAAVMFGVVGVATDANRRRAAIGLGLGLLMALMLS